MNLIPNAGAVLKHAWSVRLLAVSLVLSGLEVALPLLHGILPVSQGTFALLSFFATVGAGLARFVVQRKVNPEPDPYQGDEP